MSDAISRFKYRLGNPKPVKWTSFSGADCLLYLNHNLIHTVSSLEFTCHYSRAPDKIEGQIVNTLFNNKETSIHPIIHPIGENKLHIDLGNEYGGEGRVEFVEPRLETLHVEFSMDHIVLEEIYTFKAKNVKYIFPDQEDGE